MWNPVWEVEQPVSLGGGGQSDYREVAKNLSKPGTKIQSSISWLQEILQKTRPQIYITNNLAKAIFSVRQN
jgi:hypothetical protein